MGMRGMGREKLGGRRVPRIITEFMVRQVTASFTSELLPSADSGTPSCHVPIAARKAHGPCSLPVGRVHALEQTLHIYSVWFWYN